MGSATIPLSDLAEAGDGTMPIAIVGIGCRFPGGASSSDKLWDLVMQRRSARSETPRDRFNIDAFHHPDADRNGTLNNRGGHFLDEDIAAFDAPFFNISPAEAVSMDPMQRMLLEVVYEATENAGIPISALAGSNTSCFVGCFTSDYDQLSKRDIELLPKYHSIGTGQSILANRVSFWLDIRGPSVTLDTACSSSLVAVHLACQSLRTGESSAAIVGATNAILSPDIQVGMTNLHFLSPDSTCYTFDSRANGYARGEGMAALVLKPLHNAIRDGDTIRAVIRGTAVNSNGKTPGITMPSRQAQVSLIQSAYRQGGCDPAVTGYFEAHGTGTPIGDPIEASAIGEAIGAYRRSDRDGKLFVGSVKTNIGHLEGASGLAGLIKAVRSLEEGVIAPNIWFEKGNPAIDFDGWHIQVPTEPTAWPTSGLRRASINGFGYGGTNAHVIVDDAYHYLAENGLRGHHRTRPPPLSGATLSQLGPDRISDKAAKDRPMIFYLSAHEREAVENAAKSLSEYLVLPGFVAEGCPLEDLAWTLSERRSRLEFGTAFVASSASELAESLKSAPEAVRRSPRAPRVAFVFTGQGAQWQAMGRELLQYPVFRQTMVACERAIQSCGASWLLLDELQRQPSRINQAEISQPVCTALQIALVELYASWNILPTRVVGHSSGEIAAAYATGALTLEPAMRVAYFRGLLSSKLKTLGYNGSMLAVGMSEADATNEMEAMGEASGRIVVACVNSPRSVTLSGDRPAISQMQTVLTGKNVFARKLQVDTAYHSHHMLALSEEYRLRLSALDVVSWKDRKQVTMFSSLKGRQLTAEDDLSADYWVENMVSCVRFLDALTGLFAGNPVDGEEPADFLVELGPHSALAGPVKQTLANFGGEDKKSPIRYMSALFRGKDAAVSALDVAGSLFAQGYPVNLRAVNFPCPPKTPLRVVADLPTFAWNRTRRYWAESRLSLDYRFRHAARTDILGAPSHDWNPIEPRWRNFIRLPEQPWVRGHVVQKVLVYPAAGFCCMALQAAAQLHAHAAREGPPPPVGEYRIRDLSVSRALVIPQTEEGVEVSLSLRPAPLSSVTSSESWKEFRIFSYTEADGWAEHCRGLVSVALKKAASPTLENWDTSGKTRVEPKALYAALDAAGLSYGPEFQGIVDISIGQGQAVGTVQVTDTPSVMPSGFEFDRLIHPATMDAFLQTSIAALTDGDMGRLTQPYVPTLITEIVVSGEVSAPVGHTFRVVAEAKARGFREVCANVSASAEGTTGLVQLRGIKCVAIAPPTAQDARELKRHCATVVWEPDVDLLDREKLDGLLQACAAPGTGRLRDLELLAYHFFDRVLNEIKETEVGSMKPHHQKFFRYMQRQRELVLSHRHEQQTEDWGRLGDADVISKIANLVEHFSADADYEGRMFVRMGEALIAVLRQDEDPLALMMKDNLLYDYYTVGLGTPSTYPQVSRYITLLSHKYPDLDYLEIGAGTGGCTTPVLQALREPGRLGPARAKSYTYTDISAGFFEQAADKFRGWSDILEFRKLDVERDPDSQGFRGQRFDVIVAANVLHATYDMDATIRNVRQLLRPGGKLILLDMTHSLLSVSLIFGNLPGWWNCREPWREFGPLLDQGQWRDVLNRHGFSDLEASSPDTLEPLEEGTRVMIASAVVPESSPPSPHPTLLIVKPGTAGEREHVVETIASELLNAGVKIDMITLEELAAQDTSLDGTAIISFAELDKPLWANISPHQFAALKRLIQESAGLIWVTRGGAETRAPRPELSLFHGLARSLRAEREGIPYITVDLAAHAQQLPAAEAAALILEVARRGFRFGKPSNNTLGVGACFDREFSEMDGILHIKRAIEAPSLNRFVAARANPSAARDPEPQDIRSAGSSRPLKLIPRSIGTLDSLVFDDDKAIIEEPLPADHVDIDVRAVGLNFRDILICLGDVTDTYLGNECAGVVTRIGSAVRHLAVGDRVAAWCLGSFATTVRNPARCVQQIPEGIGFAAAAALPLVAVTAYYGLVQVARLAKGETVLIHAAAGGVGQAALQIAQMLGAKVFATVGSEEKKALLMRTYGIPENRVFSSRDLSFAEGVRQATGRRGVDVVLNSLAGEALQATWNLVAPFGRFVEIGKKDIDLNARLDMAPFSRNVTFSSIDVTVVFRQNPKLAGQLFSEVMELVRAGHVKAATPLLVQPFSKIQDSMALMQAGKHMGKIVLEPRANNQVAVLSREPDPLVLSPDASYLLAGGLGGLGRSISRWMVSCGARNLIFVSRTGISSPEGAELIEQLRLAGVAHTILQCDVADEERLSACLSSALKTMPPLRGVIQGAMVLKDQVFANMSFDTFVNTVRPKVQGSWALHHATLQQPLDFFVLLSSAASFVGNAGQSNYAAGCAYQVALASHRRQLGLPATAIDVGKVTGVGFVAENAGSVSEQNLVRLGMLDIEEVELLAMLEMAMADSSSRIPNGHLVTGIHSTNDAARLPPWARDPVFCHMDFVRPHLRAEAGKAKGSGAAEGVQQPLPTLLGSASSVAEAEAGVTQALLRKLARSLLMRHEEMDAKKPASTYGVDSLVAVELRNWFSREAKVEVPVFEILQAPSLATLAARVVGRSPLIKAR